MGIWQDLARLRNLVILTILTAVLIYAGRLAVIRAEEPLRSSYDVVVVGSSPEAISAAVASGEAGARTLLIDSNHALGGLITQGWLNSLDMNYLPDGTLATRGFFTRFWRAMGRDSVDVAKAGAFFEAALDKPGRIDVALGYTEIQPISHDTDNDNRRALTGVAATAPDGRRVKVAATRFIDATPDADFAVASGARYTVGREDAGRDRLSMAPTLVFKLKGVEWNKVRRALEADGDPGTGANSVSAWGFGSEARAYVPVGEGLYLRGLNLGRQEDGTVLVNALLIFGVDPLDRVSLAEGRRRAAAELPKVAAFLKTGIPGFSAAELAGAAPELYVRESRHVTGLYRLSINDVLDNRAFPDTVAVASYPVDMQPYAPGDFGTVVGAPTAYGIPFRSLVPAGLTNLLVVGRSASFDSLAAGSARVIPVGMATGEAAGVAAALSLERRRSFPALAADRDMVSELRGRLKARGAYVGAEDVLAAGRFAPSPFPDGPLGEGLRVAVRLGLAQGGYGNDFGLSQKVSPAQLADWLRRIAPSASLPGSLVSKSLTRAEAYQALHVLSGAGAAATATYAASTRATPARPR